jgi:MoaA/NifB/PqqE/SkfB family radical SAM enzyme
MSVYITGGDPRKHEGCTEIIQYASNIGLSCNLLINGVALTEEFASAIPDRVFVVVSYDGLIGSKSLRGILPETVMESVRVLSEARKRFALEGVLFHDNVTEMASTIRHCHDLGLDFQLIDILPIGRAKQYPGLLLQESDLDAAIEAEIEWRNFLVQRAGQYPLGEVANPNTYGGVAELVEATGRPEPGVFVAYVSSDGYLYPDNYYAAEDWFREANLREVSFAQAWQSSFAKLRDLNVLDFRDCLNCPARANGQFCDLQNLALSSQLYGSERVCGAYSALRKLKGRRAALSS